MRKTIPLLFACFLLIQNSFGGGYTLPAALENKNVKHSVVFKNYNYSVSRFDDEDERCPRYRKMTIAGAVVLGCGVGAVSGGVVMILTGLNNTVSGSSSSTGGVLRDVGLIAGGYVVTVLGVFMTGAGTALTAIGGTKMRKYCGKRGESLNVAPRLNGVAVAYRF